MVVVRGAAGAAVAAPPAAAALAGTGGNAATASAAAAARARQARAARARGGMRDFAPASALMAINLPVPASNDNPRHPKRRNS
jgi:hypothetical protein